MKPPSKKKQDCPNCGTYGNHSWHHVFNGPLKKKSEKYNAVEYWCDLCHIWNTDSIHNNAELRLSLKQKHQRRIMQEQGWSMEQWLEEFGKNYL